MSAPRSLPADVPAGAPLLIHVNAPYLPLALLKLPRRLLGRAAGDRLLGVGASRDAARVADGGAVRP